ncbi:MAG: hypothetical protein ILO68_01000, partial [Clostridia bacterium]|nr:hypothetical protein [Clostridia bacterium]
MTKTRTRLRAAALLLAVLFLLSPAAVQVSADGIDDLTVWTLNGFDVPCRTGFAVVYTAYGQPTGTEENCVDVVVRSDGVVLSVEANNATLTEKGGFILSGAGVKAKTLKALQPGDRIRLDRKGDAGTVTIVTKSYSPFTESSVTFNGRNRTRAQDLIILYDAGTKTNTNEWGYEVSVDRDGTVISVGGNDSPIPEGGFVLSGHGKGKTALEAAAKTGMSVEVDASAMTVYFRMDANALKRAYAIRVEEAKASLETARKDCRVFDETAAGNAITSLERTYALIESHLDAGNMDYLGLQELEFASVRKTLDSARSEARPAELRG